MSQARTTTCKLSHIFSNNSHTGYNPRLDCTVVCSSETACLLSARVNRRSRGVSCVTVAAAGDQWRRRVSGEKNINCLVHCSVQLLRQTKLFSCFNLVLQLRCILGFLFTYAKMEYVYVSVQPQRASFKKQNMYATYPRTLVVVLIQFLL